jgi:Tol biopolymer transport system component
VHSGSYGPYSLSREGQYLFATNATPKTGADIWVLPLFGNRKPFPYVQTEFQDIRPRLSPDGHWLAYTSNESKRVEEAYVIGFPEPGAKSQISNGGGAFPTWSRDGRSLYYFNRVLSQVMAVDMRPGEQFEFGVPMVLFHVRISSNIT